MIKSYLAKASPISALILALHLLAATGFASTVPARHKHRRASAAHPTAAAQRPGNAPRQPVGPSAARTAGPVSAFQTPKPAAAGPRPVPPSPAVIAGGPWTSPTYADSTDG